MAAMTLAMVVGVATAVYIAGNSPAPPPAYPSTPPIALDSHLPGLTPGPGSRVVQTTRLVVPAGHIDIAVIQGDGVQVPLHLAMHYPGTGQPGGGTNSLYYAHAQPGMFQGLYDLHPGDSIDADRADGSSLTYRVVGIRKVAYNDRSVLNPTPFDQITLLTCTSYDPYTPRLIVIATPA